METLRNVKCGQTVSVVKLHGEGAVKRRIMDHKRDTSIRAEGSPSG